MLVSFHRVRVKAPLPLAPAISFPEVARWRRAWAAIITTPFVVECSPLRYRERELIAAIAHGVTRRWLISCAERRHRNSGALPCNELLDGVVDVSKHVIPLRSCLGRE